MKEHAFLARKLDVAAFAREGATLSGEWPALEFERVAEFAAPEAPASTWPPVQWTLTGERREPRGSEAQVWVSLEASAQVSLTCQRCLQPVREHLSMSRWYRFARTESEAAELDAESDDDVLVLSRSLDTLELVEDELLLSLPLVPRHEECPQPLLPPASVVTLEEASEDERPNPFAALAALKKDKG
ncbi:YceD family protein [Roseateles koreensis]|uniref:Large ribosomal RNA subunit accumulation protein YceD n=1 Tax=Roseateles koreensis TaxID=2987526 RepID=A0ABT5KNZ4_9BURK|nr:DUF177 domain-containing protein [Roseateles koreensis]MDC8784088.1 DUF177 domain-containing protein [Roseateles koreensis]